MADIPLIADIKRHSLEDGPGIRSVVFFKGCPMSCSFCHNPECQSSSPEIIFLGNKCILCHECEKACEKDAVDFKDPRRINRDTCNLCGKCADACPASCLRIIGKQWNVEKLVGVLMRDELFYRHSGGGITISGGEAAMFPDYLNTLLHRLKELDQNVLLETGGCFNYSEFHEKILPFLDTVYYDLKFSDDEEHLRHTGVSNRLILENFINLKGEQKVEVHARTPLVPGVTDTKKNLSGLVDFLCDVGAPDLTFMPYNPMWIDTAVSIGREKPTLPASFMTPAEETKVQNMFREILKEKEVKCVLGSDRANMLKIKIKF